MIQLPQQAIQSAPAVRKPRMEAQHWIAETLISIHTRALDDITCTRQESVKDSRAEQKRSENKTDSIDSSKEEI